MEPKRAFFPVIQQAHLEDRAARHDRGRRAAAVRRADVRGRVRAGAPAPPLQPEQPRRAYGRHRLEYLWTTLLLRGHRAQRAPRAKSCTAIMQIVYFQTNNTENDKWGGRRRTLRGMWGGGSPPT